ncbi:uncharacterized protein DUF2183 [Balneicella halophila]|uniref:Uncharacterized protein DUF2183 n=1 Tax=Balneicella halophila TaxID=1537566 RepID=A0A7L4URQ0_BALHA|nr:phosphatase domain-containing protein [Balneicella halophila]PVX52446.1 uncharacterized protein DUF2183 [Balneicella halophila]
MSLRNVLTTIWKQTKDISSEWFDDDPLMIIPFISYANANEVVIRGRVIENEGGLVTEEDGSFQNFINAFRSFETDEARNIDVIITYNGNDYKTQTDNEGYFSLSINDTTIPSTTTAIEWKITNVFLPDYLNEKGNPINDNVKILIPHSQSSLGIITDIDDTVLNSYVDSFLKLRLIYETLFENAHTRTAFDGIGDALQALTGNANGEYTNPIFYLSNSPWNLYSMLHLFLKKNKLPEGPMFLRDFGYKRGKAKHEHIEHKTIQIEYLLRFYKNLSFILIGDATEQDVYVYLKAYKKYPDRIKKIFIRATSKESKNQKIKDLIKENPEANLNLIYHSNEITTLSLKD